MGAHKGSKFENFARQRSSMFFLLAPEAPMRAKNWIGARWDRNLTCSPEGLWTIHFSGDELKIETRGTEINTYEITFSYEASACIDRWREVLEAFFGPDFETTTPWVFPSVNFSTGKGRQAAYCSFGLCIVKLCLELRNVHYNMHQCRRVIATAIITRLGPPGLMIAANRLGDKPETVMKFYLSELDDSSNGDLKKYLSSIRRKD
ncbi:hypothetical protein [Deinococcus sp. UYEF24]